MKKRKRGSAEPEWAALWRLDWPIRRHTGDWAVAGSQKQKQEQGELETRQRQ